MKPALRLHLRPLLMLMVASAFVTACQPTSPKKEPASGKLTVAVAASMRFAFEDIITAFRAKQPGVEIAATYGASGSFFAQLTQRAPFDLFLSADTEYPEKLVAQGLAEKTCSYAVGKLVLWAPKSAGLNVAERGMECLTDPKVTKVSIANPELAPYGRAAVEAIRHAGLESRLGDKLVRAENVAQAAQFVQSGAAQIGFTAYSLALSKEMREAGDFWIVPEEFHSPLRQSGVVVPWSRNRAGAEALRDFILGEEGQGILEKHGFSSPQR